MATTDTKPGFRLPWASDRGESDPQSAPDEATNQSGDPVAGETDAAAMIDVEPATADQVDTTGTADLEPASSDGASASADAVADPGTVAESAPSLDSAAEADAASSAPVTSSRKPSKFLADLTKAMQATAEAARAETMERFAADAKAASERVHADAADEITELRRTADDDVAAIRDWSKGEIARIREQTETKISARKTDLEGELETHAGIVERRVERVSAAVAAYEAEMADFFERLLAEEDPSKFATMAERIPEPPSLEAKGSDLDFTPLARPEAHVAEAVVETVAEDTEASAEAVSDAPADVVAEADPGDGSSDETVGLIGDSGPAEAEPTTDPDDPRLAMLGETPDFAAAEADAAMTAAEAEVVEDVPEDIPSIAEEVVAARLAGLVPPSEGNPEQQTVRVVVTGLVSVASIAGFKRGLARTTGVGAVGVTSGPDGEFVFNVSHAADIDLKAAIAALPGFDAKVTGESADGFEVAARDPEARD